MRLQAMVAKERKLTIPSAIAWKRSGFPIINSAVPERKLQQSCLSGFPNSDLNFKFRRCRMLSHIEPRRFAVK